MKSKQDRIIINAKIKVIHINVKSDNQIENQIIKLKKLLLRETLINVVSHYFFQPNSKFAYLFGVLCREARSGRERVLFGGCCTEGSGGRGCSWSTTGSGGLGCS